MSHQHLLEMLWVARLIILGSLVLPSDAFLNLQQISTSRFVTWSRLQGELNTLSSSIQPDAFLRGAIHAPFSTATHASSVDGSANDHSSSSSSDDRLVFLTDTGSSPSRRLMNVITPTVVPPHTGHKKVLVTGAAGFVASHVADFLLDRGDSVVVIDEINDYYNVSLKEANLKLLQDKYGSTGRLSIYRGDICDKELVETIFEKEKPNWMCHLAARAGVRPSILDPFVYIHSNIEGTTRLFDMAVKYGIENIVFASSSSVYGGSKSSLFDEEENVDFPISPYAASKRACELLASYYHYRYNLPITGLRFFTVYGPRGRPDMAPFKFIDWTARGKPIQQFGNGSSSRDYTFVSDIVSGVVRALDRAYPLQLINLGKGTGTQLSKFIQMVGQYVGRAPDIRVLPDQPGDVPYTCANVTRARVFHGYQSEVPIEDGIQQTVAWYQKAFPYESRAMEKKNPPLKRRRLNSLPMNQSEPQRRRLGLDDSSPHRRSVLVTVPSRVEGGHLLLAEHVIRALAKGEKGGTHVVVVQSDKASVEVRVESEKNKAVFVRGDLNSTKFWEGVLWKHKPKVICHLAGQRDAIESSDDPYTYIDDNVVIFTRLLESIRSSLPNIQNFVYLSSAQIYSSASLNSDTSNSNGLWSESRRVPFYNSPYAVTQKTRELFAHTWHHLYQIPMTGLRLPVLYGPRIGLPLSLQLTLRSKVDPSMIMENENFVYLDDAVNGIVEAMNRTTSSAPFEVINLGGGVCFSDLVSAAAEIWSLSLPLDRQKMPHLCLKLDTSKAQRMLNLPVSTSVRDGMKRTLASVNRDAMLAGKTSSFPSPQTGVSQSSQSLADGLSEGLEDITIRNLESLKPLMTDGWSILFNVQWLLVGAFIVYRLFFTRLLRFRFLSFSRAHRS